MGAGNPNSEPPASMADTYDRAISADQWGNQNPKDYRPDYYFVMVL